MPPYTMALSTLRIVQRPRHGIGAFNAGCRFWEDPRLLRTDSLAAALAESLEDAPTLVMRANGAVTVGGSIEIAAGFAWCLEDAARIEHLVRAAVSTSVAESSSLTTEEISRRQVSSGGVFERLWDYMVGDDPEACPEEARFPEPRWGTLCIAPPPSTV
jgi:HCOMODA/2-hydroxy-3-carboxy-muconic semialdehyde decarboxylase